MKRIAFGIILLGLLFSVGTLGLVTPGQAGELTQAGIELQYRKCIKACAGDLDCIEGCEKDKGDSFKDMEYDPCREAYRNCKENCYQHHRGDNSCNEGCQNAFKACIGK